MKTKELQEQIKSIAYFLLDTVNDTEKLQQKHKDIDDNLLETMMKAGLIGASNYLQEILNQSK